MTASRRYLPTMALLSAFEAAARHGSVTAAAQELNLTQSAVSRQIRALEEQFGVELFIRERQTIRLTPGGAAYAREIRDALRKIGTASLSLQANLGGGALNLAILPTFGTRWLAPRLPRFLALNLGVTINLTTRLSSFEFRVDALDAAIHFGQPDWPGTEAAFLRTEEVVPTCSPDLARRHGFEHPADLRAAPLFHLVSRPDGWARWFAANGAPAGGLQGMFFDQFATVTQATVAGAGVALLPTFLIEDELATGRLVRALDLPMESPERYYLVWPVERAAYPPLAAFRDWLVAEANAMT